MVGKISFYLNCPHLAVILILIEALALALEEVRPNRHDLDRLAIAADHSNETINSNILVLAIVYPDVFKTFKIGVEGQVANLTTNKASGHALTCYK